MTSLIILGGGMIAFAAHTQGLTLTGRLIGAIVGALMVLLPFIVIKGRRETLVFIGFIFKAGSDDLGRVRHGIWRQ